MASLLGLASYNSDNDSNASNSENEVPHDASKIDPKFSVMSSISIDSAPLVLYSVRYKLKYQCHRNLKSILKTLVERTRRARIRR